ncbi:hypothetical protein L3X38_002959 [Prunus dulcis]|uniref:Ubiquitin-like protease family profile domain-containing protein n=1 Tax=Prunus dulcis TaxID=3755 RepID=A0AAD4WVN8_PRUDU|nr:hypothetical protein L3X38_002959 [Prunus dulcis]
MPPEPLTGEEVLQMVEGINYKRGSKNGRSVGENDGDRVCWKKKSKFFDIEYCKYLPVRHVLDVMDIEKNIWNSIIGTLLEIPGKNKDGIAAWLWAQQIKNTSLKNFSKLDLPPTLLALCQYSETKLKALNETVRVNILEEVFGYEHDTYILDEDILQLASMVDIESTVIKVKHLFDYLKMANMVNLVGLVNHGQVSAQSGKLSHRSKHLADHLKKANGDQFFLAPYNPGGHWVLAIVRQDQEMVYYMDSLPNSSVDEDLGNIVNTAIKMYTSHVGKQSRELAIWKTLHGTPGQPTNVECGYYVIRFMRNIIHDPALAFEKKVKN